MTREELVVLVVGFAWTALNIGLLVLLIAIAGA